MDQDTQHLQLLSIFHYVVAGLAGCFSLLPIVHLMLGLGLVGGAWETDQIGARAMGCVFVAGAGLFILAGLTFAICLALAGWCLARRRHYTFCLVMAGVACMFMPFGTVLGVFGLIVLTRPSVRVLFEGETAAADA